MKKKKSLNDNLSDAAYGNNAASVKSNANNAKNNDVKNVGRSKNEPKNVATSSNIVDVVDNEMTSEERTILAYLLRYEVMVKSQEAEDMAVREHLLPIFEKLSEGRSLLSFSEMHRWGKILNDCTPEENYVVTDSQLTMILETFGSHGMEEGWTLTAFTFCYKFIILGMQTLQHLSRQDETVRQRFKETFFQMLHQYHPENNPLSTMSADENNDEDEQDTQVMRQLLTLKDRQMSKLILNMERDDPSKPKNISESGSESNDGYKVSKTLDVNDQNDEEGKRSNGEDKNTHSRNFVNEPSIARQSELNEKSSLLSKSLIFLSLCLGFVIITFATKVYLIPKTPELIQHPWMTIDSSSLILTSPSPEPDTNMAISKSKPKFSTIREHSNLNTQLYNTLVKSQKELHDARLQIQSLVMVLTDMQQKRQELEPMQQKVPVIQYTPITIDGMVLNKPKLFQKIRPIVLSIVGGAGFTFVFQKCVLQTHLFGKFFLASNNAIKFLQASRFVGIIKNVWKRISEVTSTFSFQSSIPKSM